MTRGPSPDSWKRSRKVREANPGMCRRKTRNVPLWPNAGEALCPGGVREPGCDPRKSARDARPSVDHAEGVGMERAYAALVVVRQELGLVGRHVDVHRALPFAALAGKAQVERRLHLLLLPAAAKHFALHRFPEQAGPAASRVHLLAGRHVARAHHARFLAAFADADAAQRRPPEIAGVILVVEMRAARAGVVGDAQPQVLVHAVRIDDLAGIHPVAGIPDRLELAESVHHFFTEHERKALHFRLAVAVLA